MGAWEQGKRFNAEDAEVGAQNAQREAEARAKSKTTSPAGKVDGRHKFKGNDNGFPFASPPLLCVLIYFAASSVLLAWKGYRHEIP